MDFNSLLELAGLYFTTAARWIFMILSIFILARQIFSLLRAKNPSEIILPTLIVTTISFLVAIITALIFRKNWREHD